METCVDKIWLKHYPPGIPTEVDYGQYRSIGELFESATGKYRDRPAYTNMGRTISFGIWNACRATSAPGCRRRAWRRARGSR